MVRGPVAGGTAGAARPTARLLLPVLAAAGAVVATVVVRRLAGPRVGDPLVRQVEDQAAWAGFVLPDGFALPAHGDLPVRLAPAGGGPPEQGAVRVMGGSATLLVRRDGVLVPVTALG